MNRVILQTDRAWLLFEQPRAVISATRLTDVLPALAEIEKAVQRNQWHACGFMAYDAAPAFDPALKSRQSASFPLLTFGLFDTPKILATTPESSSGNYSFAPWHPAVTEAAYNSAFCSIRNYIQSGHTYQVNYTFPFTSHFTGDPQALFGRLVRAQQPRHAAFISTDDWTICSASPELFFSLDGDHLVSRPMKGTAARGLTSVADDRIGAQLRRSEKDRAENIMIVDMIRNDMGRIARTGSVIARPLFTLERYPNVFQLTSTVRCRTKASILEIFQALFPCASITGAPKYRATEIIHELEPSARGIYTGTIGHISPNRQAQFNIAIRTIAIHNATGEAQFGSGSGVVWDSQPGSEYAECVSKASVLNSDIPDFNLLETMLWTPADGWFLLEFHLKRLARSARYFGFAIESETIRQKLAAIAAGFPATRHRVRLLLSRAGTVDLQPRLLPEGESNPTQAVLAEEPINRQNPFLYHKTTHRSIYDKATATRPGAEVVLLWNEDNELTEATFANLVYKLKGRLYTPPESSGLLAGTYRAHLLSTGKVKARVLRISELPQVEQLFLANSIRGLWPIELGWKKLRVVSC